VAAVALILVLVFVILLVLHVPIAVGIAVAPRWSATLEHAMSVDAQGGGESVHSWLVALSWSVIPRFSIDGWFGTGISEEAFDRFGGFGMSLRMPE